MNGDQSTNEILRVVGSLESSVNRLEKVVDNLDDKFEPVIKTCQKFEIYSTERHDLPIRVTNLERVADDYLKNVVYIQKFQKTYEAGLVAFTVINALALALIALYNAGYIKVGIP